MTADHGETPAGKAGAGTADLTLDAKVAAADVPPELIAQSLGQYVRASLARIRNGNSGVLPVVLAIVIVAVVFEIITPEHAFLRPSNLVYIFRRAPCTWCWRSLRQRSCCSRRSTCRPARSR